MADQGISVRAWSGPAPEIDPASILRVHHYPDLEKVRPKIREAADRIAALVTNLTHPAATYGRVPVVACTGGVLTLAGGTQFHCPAFDRLLKGATEVVVYILTLGPELDARVVELMEEFEPLDALFVEAAGWLSIEAAIRELGAHLRETLAREGLSVAHRLGPGYDYRGAARSPAPRFGWPLEEQAQLFALFAGTELPVHLLSSAAMVPKMSRSGLFGVVPKEVKAS